MRHITPTEQVQYIKQSRFICSACGSSRDCDCNAPALERVVAYDKANPGKSTRQAAADLGVSKSEVNRARRSPVPDGTPVTKVTPATVTGRDGKTYPARQQPKAEEPDTEDVAASSAHGVAPTSKAANQKHAKEIIRLTKEVHAARREIARLKQKYEHKPDIHNGMTVPERLIAHLKEAFQLMEVGLVRSDLPKGKLRKANEIFNTIHWAHGEARALFHSKQPECPSSNFRSPESKAKAKATRELKAKPLGDTDKEHIKALRARAKLAGYKLLKASSRPWHTKDDPYYELKPINDDEGGSSVTALSMVPYDLDVAEGKLYVQMRTICGMTEMFEEANKQRRDEALAKNPDAQPIWHETG